MNSSYNHGRSIDGEKQLKNILGSLPFCFHAKVIGLKTLFRHDDLTINDLVDDLQTYEIHHFLRKKG